MLKRIMTRIFAVITLLIIGGIQISNAQLKNPEVKWYEWDEGYELAKESGKILLVDIYTDWCGWCKKMDRDTYAKDSIKYLLNKYFIAVKFNPELNKKYHIDDNEYNGRQLQSSLLQNQRSGYPTTVFLLPNKKAILSIVPGYKDEAAFKAVLRKQIKLKNS
jgi:uncharacterized protein YyaL (SSP411 family)